MVADASSPKDAGVDRITLLAAATAIVLGGGNAIGIRFLVRELDPFWGASLRFGLAALLFLGFVAVRRISLPRGRALLGVVLYGVLAFGVAFALGFWGLVRVEAGLAMVILSVVPLATLFLAALHGLEKLTWRGVAGALSAVVGFVIIVAFADGSAGEVSIPGVLAVLGAAVAISEAGVVVKRFPKVSPAVENGLAMAVGTVVLVILSTVSGESWIAPTQGETLAALAYLVLAGSIVVFGLFIFILSRWSASAASYQFVLTPFVTLPAAAWLLDEQLTTAMLLGALAVIAGVYVGALHPKARSEDVAAVQCGPDVLLRLEEEGIIDPVKG